MSPRAALLLPVIALLAGCPETSTATDASPTDSAVDASADARPDTGTPDATPSDTPTADAQPGDAACPRPDVAVLPSRTSCAGGAACPTGYECMSFSGVVLELFCGRACRSDCDCPATQVCGSYSDKAGTHPICVAR